MHTLSLFPYLLSYQQLSPFIIRIVLGLTLAHFGYLKIIQKGQSSGSNSKVYGWVEVMIAALLIIGLWTQLAALLNAIILVIKIGFKGAKRNSSATASTITSFFSLWRSLSSSPVPAFSQLIIRYSVV